MTVPANTKAPRPWKAGEGYDQNEPGVYIADADGSIVLADLEGTLSREVAELICARVNEGEL